VNEKKPSPPWLHWTFRNAQILVSALEAPLARVGWAVGMTGSVLLHGESADDLDIILYPLDTSKAPDKDAARAVLRASMNMKPWFSREQVMAFWRTKGSEDEKHVESWRYRTKRVDVFFLA
jgi:hypothetical protein